MSLRHAHEFIRLYGYGGNWSCIRVACMRLEEAKAPLVPDKRLVRDLERAIDELRFYRPPAKPRAKLTVTLKELLR